MPPMTHKLQCYRHMLAIALPHPAGESTPSTYADERNDSNQSHQVQIDVLAVVRGCDRLHPKYEERSDRLVICGMVHVLLGLADLLFHLDVRRNEALPRHQLFPLGWKLRRPLLRGGIELSSSNQHRDRLCRMGILALAPEHPSDQLTPILSPRKALLNEAFPVTNGAEQAGRPPYTLR